MWIAHCDRGMPIFSACTPMHLTATSEGQILILGLPYFIYINPDGLTYEFDLYRNVSSVVSTLLKHLRHFAASSAHRLDDKDP